jgi:hypothetical protein
MYNLDIPNRYLCQKVPPLNTEKWQVDYQKDFPQWLFPCDVQMKHRCLCNPLRMNGYRVMLRFVKLVLSAFGLLIFYLVQHRSPFNDMVLFIFWGIFWM